jgi:hypothetical protein
MFEEEMSREEITRAEMSAEAMGRRKNMSGQRWFGEEMGREKNGPGRTDLKSSKTIAKDSNSTVFSEIELKIY